MKCLIAFATLALFACINANPYGSLGGGYGGRGRGQLAYVEEGGYGGNRGYGGLRLDEGIRGYGNRGGDYGRILISEPSRNRASASAASAASAGESRINPGRYEDLAVVGYDLDSSYHGRRGGY